MDRYQYWEFLPDRLAEKKVLVRADKEDAATEDAEGE